MLLTRGIIPQIQSARSESREAYHGISNAVAGSGSVRDGGNRIAAGGRTPEANRVSVAIDRLLRDQPLRLAFGRNRLKGADYAPIGSGVPEVASAMEDCV